ncbi:MAG TPA: MFS transporter [Actinomycetales bacterium]|nr:MFS transporter [Actinomycetales bacterium]
MELRHARLAVVATFATAGFIFSNWAARLPVVKEQLDLSGSGLGILLLFASAGSLTALPLTGMLVDRFGTARVVAVMSMIMMLGSGVTVTAVVAGSTAIAAIALYLLGVGLGAWDVAMNVEGAKVEDRLDKSVMAQFHAIWSLGTVAGAGSGALMAALGVPIHFHMYGVLVLAAATVLTAVRFFLPAISSQQKLRTTSLTSPLIPHPRCSPSGRNTRQTSPWQPGRRPTRAKKVR